MINSDSVERIIHYWGAEVPMWKIILKAAIFRTDIRKFGGWFR
jgi:hypothetical protein